MCDLGETTSFKRVHSVVPCIFLLRKRLSAKDRDGNSSPAPSTVAPSSYFVPMNACGIGINVPKFMRILCTDRLNQNTAKFYCVEVFCFE